MKWSYETISAMKWIIERMNNFYFYSDEMKLQWHIWHKFFFTPHQTVSVKENHWQQYFFPLLFQPKKKKNLSNNLIVIIQLFFFSPFLHFGNETAIIKPFFSSPLYFDNDILTIQFYFSLSSLLLFSLLISVRSISVKSVGQHKNWVDISVRYCQNHLFSLFLSVTSFLSPLSYIFSQFGYTIVEIHLFSHYTYHK